MFFMSNIFFGTLAFLIEICFAKLISFNFVFYKLKHLNKMEMVSGFRVAHSPTSSAVCPQNSSEID